MVAVTGANGLLGSFITSQFISRGEKVIALKRKGSKTTPSQKDIQWREVNVLDPISLNESLVDVHTVVHTAALVSFNPRRSQEIFETNVTGTKNVVDACLANGVKKLIHVSSVAALGRKKGKDLINEESTWVDSSLNSEYATSKYLAELEVYRGFEEGLKVSLVNPSVILAPGDWNRSSSQIFKYIWQEKPFYTEGVMNYVDVRDVADMVYTLYKSDFNGERFIASANPIRYKKIFDEIAIRFNKRSPFLKVGSTLASLIANLESIRCMLTNQEPVITKHTAQMARQSFYYDSKKAVDTLKINFRSLEETLDFCCPYYRQNITTNK